MNSHEQAAARLRIVEEFGRLATAVTHPLTLSRAYLRKLLP
jgi:hypothetical protein